MSKVRGGRLVKPEIAPQIYENKANPEGRFFDYDERELPAGPHAKMTGNKTNSLLAPNFAYRAYQPFARLVWSRESPDHVNPAAPEEGMGRLYQVVARLSPPSDNHEDYRASIIACSTAWPSGAPRREDDPPRLFVYSADSFEPGTVRSTNAELFSVRSWRPVDELAWT